jgi:UDP-glucose 4-epimerase
MDLARGHVDAIEYMMSHKGENVFNLGTGRGYSVLEMVETFKRVNGVDIPYKIMPRRAGDLATCYADPGKSAEKLGWKAEYGLDEMCRDSWNWQKKNPSGFGD